MDKELLRTVDTSDLRKVWPWPWPLCDSRRWLFVVVVTDVCVCARASGRRGPRSVSMQRGEEPAELLLVVAVYDAAAYFSTSPPWLLPRVLLQSIRSTVSVRSVSPDAGLGRSRCRNLGVRLAKCGEMKPPPGEPCESAEVERLRSLFTEGMQAQIRPMVTSAVLVVGGGQSGR